MEKGIITKCFDVKIRAEKCVTKNEIINKEKILTILLLWILKDYKNIIRAICDLQSDIDSVTGIKPEIVAPGAATDYGIIIGMLGKSKTI